MTLGFIPSDAAMLALQAGVVAAPRAVPRIDWLRRFRGWGWALVPIASIVGVIFGIRYVSDTATWLTYLALIAVPLLAAVALGWAMRGSTPLAALGAVPLFAIAWAAKDSLARRGRGVAPVCAQLRDARRAAGRRDAAGLAEGRDPADGRSRRLAGRLGPAAEPQRDARRGAAGCRAAAASVGDLRLGDDGLRRPVRRRPARSRAGHPAPAAAVGRAADACVRRPYSTCCSSSSQSFRRRCRSRSP